MVHFAPESVVHFTTESVVHFAAESWYTLLRNRGTLLSGILKETFTIGSSENFEQSNLFLKTFTNGITKQNETFRKIHPENRVFVYTMFTPKRKRVSTKLLKPLSDVVGDAGLEPATPCL